MDRFKIIRVPAKVLLAPSQTMFTVHRVEQQDVWESASGEVVANNLDFDSAIAEQAKLGADYDALISSLLEFEPGSLSHFRVVPVHVG
jgi:hypothetical protein